MRLGRCALLWFLLNNAVTAFTLLAQARPSSGRPLTVRDVLAAEELGDVRVAPDGETLAIVVKRARLVGERYHTGPLWYYHRGDVWIASSRGASIRNITNGGRDAAGYWNPVWSPDSKRLAMLSNRGGDIARLYVWHSAASAPFQVADGAVDIDVEFRADGMPIGPIAWLDARRLLCMLRSTIDDPDMTILAASRAWAKAEGGREPTASVIDTYVGTLAQREVLAIIDVTTRQIDTVTVTQPFALTPQPNQPRIVDIAPNRRIAAWIAQSGEVRRSAEVPVRYGDAAGPLRLGMVSLQPGSVVQWFDQIEPWFGGVYNPGPWSAWNLDGRRFALLGTRPRDFKSASVFVVDAMTDLVSEISPPGWRFTTIRWAQDVLVARGDSSTKQRDTNVVSTGTRMEWWRLDIHRHRTGPVNLTAGLSTVPSSLTPVGDGELVGIAGGAVWRLNVFSRRAVKLTDPAKVKVVAFAGDSAQPGGVRGQGQALVAITERDGIRRYVLLSFDGTFRVIPIPQPSPAAELVTYRHEGFTAFTSGSADLGPVVWTRRSGSRSFTPIVTLNRHLSSVHRSDPRWIDYLSTEGDSLEALLLLPIGYKPGCRYPLVVWVYGGVVWNSSRTDSNELFKVSSGFPLNLQLLAAHGYAVLWPSIPLETMGTGRRDEPYSRMPHGVMPAVERVIDLGIADPERLAVMGHSYGAYSTYSLIAQTPRFRAAIGLAGPTDLISWYGTFNPWRRYSEAPHQSYYAPLMAESGLARMGGSPYTDLERYIRNSPLFHVENVRTPLLIIHGDLDPVAIEQAEELFTALHRLGKPARFVRYWGEGHVVSSPANVLHMWQQIFDWLNRYLPALSHAERRDVAPATGTREVTQAGSAVSNDDITCWRRGSND